MPFFILDTKGGHPVPGTQTSEHRQATEALQRVPRPSKSTQDPLNWPLARKNFVLGILCIHSLLAAVLNPILATNTFQLVAAFKVTFTKVAMLTGFNVLALAIAALFFSATCRVYGRRHTFLLGSVLMLAGCFWAAKADTYHSMLGARILQGIGIAPFEGLVQVVVADLYFTSQRGRAYACVAVSYLVGVTVTPIVTGKLDVELGRRAPFYILGGFVGFFTLVIFFFLEETAFVRDMSPDVEAAPRVGQAAPGKNETVVTSQDSMPVSETPGPSSDDFEVANIKTFAFARSSPFSGRYSNDSLIRLIVRPILLCAHPAVFWGVASAGLITAWTVMLATVMAAIFITLGPARLGFLYAAPLVAAVITLPLAGLASDSLVSWMTRRRGVYEPEYRIILMLPCTLAAVIGLYGFGHTVTSHQVVVPTVFFGFVISAVIFANVATASYVADAYAGLEVDCFIAFLLVKNLLAFVLTVRGVDWLFADGVERMFTICGSAQIGVCALSLPMFVLGKRIRKWTKESAFWQKVFL